MFRKILVPLDGSPFSEHALPAALALVERRGGELHLASVAPAFPALTYSGEDPDAGNEGSRSARESAQTYLQEVIRRIGEAGHAGPVHAHVLVGGPVRALDDWATTQGVDQIVMTTHGRGRIQRFWLGSVADGLIRHAPCAILLWRATSSDAPDLSARPAIARILVPLDGSERGAAILPWAEGLARLFGAEMALASIVINPPLVGRPYSPHLEYGASAIEARAGEVGAYLAGVRERLEQGGIHVTAEVSEGPDAAGEILSRAKRQGADLIALSTRGRGGAARLVLGSVADKVIRGSEEHVLVHRDAD